MVWKKKMAYTAGYTPVLFKDKKEDRNNLPRIVDVELRILLWYEVAKISSWKYCNLLHRTVRFQGHVSTKHTFNCAAAFDTVEIYPELRMGWRSVRGVFIVSWGTLCKKWPCCCLCYSFFSWLIIVWKKCCCFSWELSLHVPWPFIPPTCPMRDLMELQGKAGIVMDKSSKRMKCLNFCLEECENRLVFDFWFFPHTTAEVLSFYLCLSKCQTLI